MTSTSQERLIRLLVNGKRQPEKAHRPFLHPCSGLAIRATVFVFSL